MEASVLVLLLLTSCIVRVNSDSDRPRLLDVLFVHSYCIHENFNSREIFDKVNDAVETFNSSLNGASWNINFIEGGAEMSSMDAVLKTLLAYNEVPRDFLAILFPGCLENVQYIAEISDTSLFNTALLTFAFSELDSAQMSRPNHFRMIPGEQHLASAIAAIIDSFEWKRMVLFTQPLAVFIAISERVRDQLKPDNVTVTTIELLEGSDSVSFPKDNRIFVLNVYPALAMEILCQAYHQDMLFPDYVWITYGWYSSDWYMDKSLNLGNNCTSSEIAAVLVGSIAPSHYVYPSQSNSSYQTVTGAQMYTRIATDAVLTLVNALNASTNSSNLKELIRAAQFSGQSGPIAFENMTNLRMLDQVSVFQYHRKSSRLSTEESALEMIKIGHVPVSNASLAFEYSIFVEDIWQGEVPADGTPVTVLNYPLIPLLVVCYTMASAGIIFAAVCFIFNIAFRKRRLIRLTSPTINYVIILGAVVFYSSVYTFFYAPKTHPDTITVVCNFRLWLTSIGFSLCYVPINVKMWRVYHISRKPSLKKAVIRDWHLMMFILMFVVFDLLLLGIVTLIESSRYSVIVIPDKEHPGTFVDEHGFTASYEVNRCYSATELYWLPVIFGYKFLLQAIGVYLAFSIRKVKIKGLNDSREVSIILYITSAILFVVMLETFILGDYINVDGGVYGLGISVATTVVLAFLFVPKMYGLYKDPKGENIFATKSPSHFNSGTIKSQLASSSGNGVAATKPKAVNPLYEIEVSDNILTDLNSSNVSNSSSGKVEKGAEESSCE